MHPDWTLRVPILRPRLAAWLDAVALVAALASAWAGLYWQAPFTLPVLAAAGCALAAVATLAARIARPAGRRSARGAVRAVRMDRDGAFHLRMRDGWHPVEWVAAWRGPRWLTLRARLTGGICNAPAVRRPCVTFTVWQDALPAAAWRRTCLLVNRRLCRSPVGRPVGAP
ncbi:hypothetical protein [Bordetella bronchialis]|uniref:Toxin CptA n=1 Tax=Bordetella bronchialis TaxID=463025 RepID=A0ABN4QYW8_9BORD|nr:hypothetical protein [Bordetella bronchialis]ANN66223.1 hypothetical protein BAU06_07895 [Bordetella bronchialis]